MSTPAVCWAVSAAWLIVFAGSFVATQLIEPTGDGFVRGMNRAGAFLALNTLAGALAFAAWRAARSLPPRQHVLRWIGILPVLVTVAFVLAVTLAVVVAVVTRGD